MERSSESCLLERACQKWQGAIRALCAALAALCALALQGEGRSDSQVATADLQAAADKGDVRAQRQLADTFYRGQDPAQTLEWYRKAAEQGDAHSQWQLARYHEFGIGQFPVDRHAALSWYLKAATQGFSNAQLDLGQLFENGIAAAPDYIEAHKWYSLALANHCVLAQANRDRLMIKMTSEQIQEGQRRADEFNAIPGRDPAVESLLARMAEARSPALSHRCDSGPASAPAKSTPSADLNSAIESWLARASVTLTSPTSETRKASQPAAVLERGGGASVALQTSGRTGVQSLSPKPATPETDDPDCSRAIDADDIGLHAAASFEPLPATRGAADTASKALALTNGLAPSDAPAKMSNPSSPAAHDQLLAEPATPEPTPQVPTQKGAPGIEHRQKLVDSLDSQPSKSPLAPPAKQTSAAASLASIRRLPLRPAEPKTVAAREAALTAKLRLSAIAAFGKRRAASINGRSVFQGEEVEVSIEGVSLRVRCVEVRDSSAVLQVAGVSGTTELKMLPSSRERK